MPSGDNTASARVLRRVRTALADLDRNSGVDDADRLDVLYAIQEELTRRILTMEHPNGISEDTPASTFSPVRF